MKRCIMFVVSFLALWCLFTRTVSAQHILPTGTHVIPSNITSLIKDKLGNLYAGTSSGIYKSVDHGNRWHLLGLESGSVWPICCDSNNNIIACQNHATFVSTNFGKSWTKNSIPLNWSLTADKFGNIFGRADNFDELWRSTDGGSSWSKQTQSVRQSRIAADTLGSLFGIWDSNSNSPSVYKSTDQGASWVSYVLSTDWHRDWSPRTLYVSRNNLLYVGTSAKGTFVTGDTGATWMWPLRNGAGYIGSIITDENDSTILATDYTDYAHLIKSFDGGHTWELDKLLQWSSEYAATLGPQLIQDTGNLVHLGVSSSIGIWDSYDFGHTWEQHPSGLSTVTPYCLAYDSRTQSILMGTSDGILVTKNRGYQWRTLDSSTDGKAVHALLLLKEAFFVVVNDDSIRISTDAGVSWRGSLGGLGPTARLVFDSITHLLFAVGSDGALYRSVDSGQSWTYLSTIVASGDLVTTAAARGRIVIGTRSGHVRSSVDGGLTWNDVGSAFATGIVCLSINGTDVYAGVEGQLSMWDSVSQRWTLKSNWTPLQIVTTSAGEMFILSDDSFLRNSHDGTHWYITQGELPPLIDFKMFEDTLYAIQGNTVLWSGRPLVGVESNAETAPHSSLFPNPCQNGQLCTLYLPSVVRPAIRMFSVTGAEIQVLTQRGSDDQHYVLSWLSRLAQGLYSIQIEAANMPRMHLSLVLTN